PEVGVEPTLVAVDDIPELQHADLERARAALERALGALQLGTRARRIVLRDPYDRMRDAQHVLVKAVAARLRVGVPASGALELTDEVALLRVLEQHHTVAHRRQLATGADARLEQNALGL